MSSESTFQSVQRILIDTCFELGVPFLWHGPGTFLISGAGVLDVVRELESLGERVLGLDGFEVENTTIHPRLDLIYDSSLASVSDAESVLQDWGNNIWVDVTLASKSETRCKFSS
jgi:hypothetical protein